MYAKPTNEGGSDSSARGGTKGDPKAAKDGPQIEHDAAEEQDDVFIEKPKAKLLAPDEDRVDDLKLR